MPRVHCNYTCLFMLLFLGIYWILCGTLCSLVVFLLLFLLIWLYYIQDNISKLHAKAYYPVDTGRKLNVHKTFKRRPGRFLNVLCTFNLRFVSTGKIVGNRDHTRKIRKKSSKNALLHRRPLTIWYNHEQIIILFIFKYDPFDWIPKNFS